MEKSVGILIVGGAGFLGRWIVDVLLDQGFTNLSVLDWAGLPLPGTKYGKLKQFMGSFTDSDLVEHALDGIECVIHTASPAHGRLAEFYWAVNVEGTKKLLNICRTRVKVFVYTSSASVVYNGQSIANGSETDLDYCDHHMDAYNETKAEAEKLVLGSNGGTFRTCALRPSGIFGPRDRQCVPGFINAARNGKNKFQIGRNNTLFDYTYVENVAHAHLLAVCALYADDHSRCCGQAFNITNGSPVGFWDMPHELWRLTNLAPKSVIVIPFWLAYIIAYGMLLAKVILSPFKEFEPTFTPFRIKLMQANRYFSTRKAEEILKYKPIVSFQEGIEKTAEWVNDGMKY